ncbi:MAG: hypothetical protein IT223_01725 [Crocinitomicaceae bacterium]|nr:hypothetical protein [Crocinitomicaceae bacterium]
MNKEKKFVSQLLTDKPSALQQSASVCREKEISSPLPELLGFAALAAATVSLASCKKDQEALFEVNNVMLYDNSADKSKLKSNEQYVSILYTNLFQTALSNNTVFELGKTLLSLGDQELAREVLISNFFNDAGVQMPTADEMNADIDAFIVETYKRFFVRLPSEAEKTWVKNFIERNAYMTPELVYFSFAMSNEYMYY